MRRLAAAFGLICALALSPASARLGVTQLHGFNQLHRPQLARMEFFGGDTNATAYSSTSISVPRSGMLIAACTGFSTNTRTVSSITFGGVAGTLAVATGADTTTGAVGYREVAAGSYTITVNFSATMASGHCYAWLAFGYKSATPVDADENTVNSGPSRIIGVETPSLGFAVFNCMATTANDLTWSNASEIVEGGFDSSRRSAMADRISVTESLNAETCTWGDTQSGVLVGASWR